MKIGVAANIQNPRFFEPTSIPQYIHWDTNLGQSWIAVHENSFDPLYFSDVAWVDDSDPASATYQGLGLHDFLRTGDRVRLTSTSSEFYGMSEVAVVKEIAFQPNFTYQSTDDPSLFDAFIIKFAEPLKYTYKSGDYITAYGTRAGGAWKTWRNSDTYNNGSSTRTEKSPIPYSCNGMLMFPKEHDLGRVSPMAQVFYDASGTSYYTYIYQRVRLEVPEATYRIGVYGKSCSGGTITCYASGNYYDSIGDLTSWTSLGTITSTSWTELTDTHTFSSVDDLNPFGSVLFKIQMASGSDKRSYLSEFFMEHALETSGSASGVYDIPDYPDVNVVIKPSKVLRNYGDGDFFEIEKYDISMQFSNVDKTTYVELQKFLNWQEQGDMLVLHLEEPYTDSYPSALYGTMSLGGMVTKEIWNPDKCTFTLKFLEV